VKIFFKNLYKIFGVIEKLLTPLQYKLTNTKNMLRKQSHIEVLNGWMPISDFTVCGACYAKE
jgi:hypothetical protein